MSSLASDTHSTMLQLLHPQGGEVTIRDVYRAVIDANAYLPATSVRARGAADAARCARADARCHSESINRGAASEPPRSPRYISGPLSHISVGGIRAADRSRLRFRRAQAVLPAAGAQGL